MQSSEQLVICAQHSVKIFAAQCFFLQFNCADRDNLFKIIKYLGLADTAIVAP